jgi:hypothetical protein
MSARAVWFGLAALVLAVPGGLAGQPADVTLAPADVLFPEPVDIDFSAGWVDHDGVTVTIQPKNKNKQNWQLFVQASAADMGGYGKPVQDILVRAQGASSWTPLDTSGTLVAEGTGDTTLTLYFRLLLDITADVPGYYSVPLEYSANAF